VKLIVHWLINAAALYAATRVVPGVHVQDAETLVVAAAVIGLVNAIIRPILRLITLPITVLTLGLFYFVLNGLMLLLAARLTRGFELDGLPSAVVGAIVIGIVATILHLFVRPDKKKD